MRHSLRQLVLLLLVAGVLPLATDAAIAVPTASKEQACVTSDPPFPRKDGDEKFFDIASGVPNVMILLDNSGSMQDFPTDIPYPSTWPATNGTCTTVWDTFSAKLSSTPNTLPYDNGFTGLVTDAPTWAYPQCAGTANPTTDNTMDRCLFRGGGAGGLAYYKYYGNAGSMGGIWDVASAQVYNNEPCALINSAGTVQLSGSTILTAPNVLECRTCLSTKGYYLFRRGSGYTPQAVFRGDFLNVNPPKYVIARKVVKDVARIDAANPSPLDQVRLGLTVFTSGTSGGTYTGLRSGDGGVLVVPLGPNCTDAVPPTQAAYTAPRQAVVNAVNNTGIVGFNTNTPLAETLFNIGQYFSDATRYTNLFGSTWTRSTFADTAAGLINASWATSSGERQDSYCWWCQQSSVVIVTDGEPTNDDNLPKYPTATTTHTTFNNDFRKWSNSTINCPSCGSFTLHKVAYFLNQTDLRLDLDGGRQQTVSTYTISFGLNAATDATALALLQKTADLGGGQFRNTSSGTELASALNEAVSDVVSRSTGFSSANVNALQTSRTNQSDAYVARFKPNGTAAWEGHLFGGMLFDEAAQGCDSRYTTSGQALITCGTKTVNPNLNGDSDVDGHALCTGAYLVDRDCDPIIEDSNGAYKKGTFDASGAIVSTPDDANMFWDAGKVLSDPTDPGYKTAAEGLANSRKIYTSIDTNADGALTPADGTNGLVEFTAANAAALAPSMSLDADSCIQLMTDAHFCGASPLPACPTTAGFTTANRTTCAQIVINYVRGWDVLDADGDHCYGPGAYDNTNPWGSCTTAQSCGDPAYAKGVTCVTSKCVYPSGVCNGEQRDRVQDHRAPSAQTFWKLGDIFHSSPFIVRRPYDKLLCFSGTIPQCVRTVYSPPELEGTPTPMDTYGSLDAYEAWRQILKDRDQFILVGGNDGMLHAFHAGSTISGTTGLDGMPQYDNGTGTELWAYIPPDLLPKLKKSVYTHGYYVDGTTLVRDIWYDSNHDGIKQRTEFHTVAVIAERTGGSRWTALDVTNPSSPTFLWTFPDGCTPDSVLVGESWAEYLPWSPPIVPVRLKATGLDPSSRGYDERWVVLLNGGFDPALVRGRGMWMLDVWTGQKIWQYLDSDFKAVRGDAKASMFPVAATVTASDIGRGDGGTGVRQTDGMFDTATWGDVGGNVFLARFYEPGLIGANGLVSNWTAARAFEQQRQTDDTQLISGRTSFFHMSLNFGEGGGRGLKMLLGSGNRERLMDTRPVCGPDDVFGCARAGCTATTVDSASYGTGSCSASGTFSISGGQLSFTSSSSGCAASFAAPGPVTRQTSLNATCGSDNLAVVASRSCDGTGLCGPSPYKDIPFATSATFTPTALPAPTAQAKFYGMWVYGGDDPNKRFTTAAEAKVFETNRFTDIPYAGCPNWPATGGCKLVEVANAVIQLDARGNYSPVCQDGAAKCKAEANDPGWMFTFGQWCPLGPGKCSSSSPPWYDEQTGAVPGGIMGCVVFSGFRPTGSVASSDACTTSQASPTAYTYFADFNSGIPTLDTGAGYVCGLTSGTQVLRAVQQNAFAAPQAASPRASIDSAGRVTYSTMAVNPGAPPAKFTLGTRSSALEPVYWLEVPREAHTCRHADGSTCK